MMIKKYLLKNIPNSRLECRNHSSAYDHNGGKIIPFGATHTFIANIREYPLPREKISSSEAWSLAQIENITEKCRSQGPLSSLWAQFPCGVF